VPAHALLDEDLLLLIRQAIGGGGWGTIQSGTLCIGRHKTGIADPNRVARPRCNGVPAKTHSKSLLSVLKLKVICKEGNGRGSKKLHWRRGIRDYADTILANITPKKPVAFDRRT